MAQVLSRLPVMLPGLFIGIGFVALMVLSGFRPGKPMIVIGHTVVATPWVVLVMTARLLHLRLRPRCGGSRSRRLADASAAAGVLADPRSGAAWLGIARLRLVLRRDAGHVVHCGQETTVPLYIIGRLRRVVDPTGNAVAVLLLTIPWITFASRR